MSVARSDFARQKSADENSGQWDAGGESGRTNGRRGRDVCEIGEVGGGEFALINQSEEIGRKLQPEFVRSCPNYW